VEYGFIFAWGNNEKRKTLKGKKCRVIVRGKKTVSWLSLKTGNVK
jgi:hypothetical protein